MATVSLNDIKKSFGPTDVIHGITTEIADGEFIVIVGPSGCGKSTLLRMVAGLETVSDGEVQIGGVRANEKEPMDRDIAMVFQNYAITKMPAITSLQRASKPGLRKYSSSASLPRVLNGLGVAIVSTSKGVMTDKEARTLNVGGEVLCYVY